MAKPLPKKRKKVEWRRWNRNPIASWVNRQRVRFLLPLMFIPMAILPWLYIGYMRLVFATSRVHDNDFARLHDIIRDGDGAVALLWHEEVATVAYGYWRFRFNAHTLASRGDAGALITRMLELCGFTVFRGGSSRRRSRRNTDVVDAMIEHMNENPGVIYGITVDGSKGPAYRMKTGGVRIAHACGKPVALVRTWYKRSLRLRSWDRTAIPLPFNDIRYHLRGPFEVPANADDPKVLADFVISLENELIAMAEHSYREFGQAIPENLVRREQEKPDPPQHGETATPRG